MSNPVETEGKKNRVVVEDLQMIYRMGRVEMPALQGVDINVAEGEFVAIMGPSGCGKSTLLHLVGGLQKPTTGRIYVNGVEIGSVSDAERTEIRRRSMGFVFQRFNLFPALTAEDNIKLAKRIHGNGFYEENSAQQILRLLGLEEKLHHRPSELSVGEQQRLAIARAVINRPAILLADEPTGSLDSDNSQMVLQMLQELNLRYSQTLIMVTHDPEAASMASRIIEMRDGRVLNCVRNLSYAIDQNLG